MTEIPALGSSVSFVVNSKQVEQLVARAPRAAYFWLRAYLREITIEHRKTWLREKGTRFGRVSKSGRGIIVSRLNEGQKPPRDNEVAYFVEPRAERQPSNDAAREAIGQLRADIYTGNKILPVHEFGIDISSSGFMAVPVKTRPGNIHRWKEQHPRAHLITLPSRRDSKRLVYEVLLRRQRGRRSKDFVGPGPVREKLRLRWVLTKRVDMKPTLKLYASWDGLQTKRDEIWQRYATRMAKDMESGVDS